MREAQGMRPVRVGVIGVGQPWHHLPVLARLPGVTLAGLCDIDEERLKEASRTYGISGVFTDYKAMLREVSPQAVFVLPSVLRTVEIATDCIERGFHVFVEKPPGITAAQARGRADLARRRAVISMVGFN